MMPNFYAVYAIARQMWMWAGSHEANGAGEIETRPSLRDNGGSRWLGPGRQGALAVASLE